MSNRVDTSIGKVTTIFDSDATEIAERAVMRRFRQFATEVLKRGGTDLDMFFHPINRSEWQKQFGQWIIEQNTEASNE